MWKLLFLVAALTLSVSPADAAPNGGKQAEKSGRASELARDVERISREIYPPRPDSASSRRSFAAGAAMKKR
jgi:hypothetical protein